MLPPEEAVEIAQWVARTANMYAIPSILNFDFDDPGRLTFKGETVYLLSCPLDGFGERTLVMSSNPDPQHMFKGETVYTELARYEGPMTVEGNTFVSLQCIATLYWLELVDVEMLRSWRPFPVGGGSPSHLKTKRSAGA